MNVHHAFSSLCLLTLCLATSSPALGLANRVFVSARSGNNANSCDSVTTPCQTFSGAVTQLLSNGEVIVLDSGGYGPVTITQSLTIEAPPGVLAFIHPPSGDAITVNAGASDTVVLRGLVLNGGSANGITVNTVGKLHVEGCVISNFAGGFTDSGHGNGLYFGSAGQLFVKDTIVRGNNNNAILASPASGTMLASIDHCRFEGNEVGLQFMQNAKLTVRDSVSSGNAFGIDGEGGELNLENCVVANNTSTGILSSSGTIIRVSNTTVTDNVGTGVFAATGSTLVSRSNNTVRGNSPNGLFSGTFAAD